MLGGLFVRTVAVTRRSHPLIIHPFLIALFPILSLFSLNLNEVRLNDTFRSLVVGFAIAIALVLILRLVFRSWELAGLIASLFLILFFSYGHIFMLLNDSSEVVVRHRYILIVFGVLFVGAVTAAVRYRDRLSSVTELLNRISVVAVTIPLVGILSFGFQRATSATVGAFDVFGDWGGLPAVDGNAPDIYYIVLDEYADTDYLVKEFNHDNSAYEESLVENGFYLADETLSNYAHTALVLASALNMTYIQELDVDMDHDGYPSGLRTPLFYSLVRQQLEALGYLTISLDSGWMWSQLRDADQFLTAEGDQSESRLTINRFEDILVETSGGRLVLYSLLRLGIIQPETIIVPNYTHRQTILAQFEALNRAAETPGPKFVYAHIISPHRPFVFGPNGEVPEAGSTSSFSGRAEPTSMDTNKDLYLGQLEYVSKRIEEVIVRILAGSEQRPIIIIHSDTGPSFDIDWEDPSLEDLSQRMPIPNAYLVPDECRENLYPEISPVNSFRVVFNCVFGANYELLPDYSYFSGFVDINNFGRVDQLLR